MGDVIVIRPARASENRSFCAAGSQVGTANRRKTTALTCAQLPAMIETNRPNQCEKLQIRLESLDLLDEWGSHERLDILA